MKYSLSMICNPDIKNFIEVEKLKLKNSKTKVPTIMDLIKDHNHVIWRICKGCGHVFDLRMETKKMECPKCQSKNIII